MPDVQNVGAADYAQYQPSQYPNEAYVEDYNAQPEVYDEHAEQMKAASKSKLGATLLTSVVVGSIALFGGYKWGGKSAATERDAALKALNELKNSEAVQNYDKLKEAAEKVEKEVTEHNPLSWWGIKNKVKEAFSFLKKDAKEAVEETKDEVKEGAEKAVDETKDAAKELEEKATDSNK